MPWIIRRANKLIAIALLFTASLAAQYVPPGGGGGSLPAGSGNCVVASPANGSSATVACRALVAADEKAAGATGAVQYSNAGALAGSALFAFDGSGVHIGPAESVLPPAIQGWGAGNLLLTSDAGTPLVIESSATSGIVLVVDSPTPGDATGIEADLLINGNGGSSTAFTSYPQVQDGIAATSATVFRANSPNMGSGSTLATAFGLFVDDQIAAANNWAIKTGLGKVEFGDTVALTGTGPGAANTAVCWKAGGVFGWASNTAGVIGTTCN